MSGSNILGGAEENKI